MPLSLHRHPLFPLLALLFEKCEQATQGSECITSASFDVDIENFVHQQEREHKPFFSEDPELDNLVSNNNNNTRRKHIAVHPIITASNCLLLFRVTFDGASPALPLVWHLNYKLRIGGCWSFTVNKEGGSEAKDIMCRTWKGRPASAKQSINLISVCFMRHWVQVSLQRALTYPQASHVTLGLTGCDVQ